MIKALKIIPTDLLDHYLAIFNQSVKQEFYNLSESELTIDAFSFYTSVSAVFSSKIEGEEIELDSYIKYKRFSVAFLPDYTRKIDDIYDAYSFAQNNTLNSKNVSIVHSLITKNILKKAQQGKIRSSNMFVITKEGKIEYVAASPEKVKSEMQKFYDDIKTLIKVDLSFEEILFYGSMIHLVFLKIHPFDDGNGRTARLLEKWFLGQKLGSQAWLVQSEKYYYSIHQTYYNNLRILGLDFEELDYQKAAAFLQMLPSAIKSDTMI